MTRHSSAARGTHPQIDRLLALSERATAGPWQIHGSHFYGPDPDRKLIGQVLTDGGWLIADRDFIVAMEHFVRNDLPALRAKIAELEGERDTLLAERDAASARVGEMREALAIAHGRIINHEARFEEIRDFVSEKLGTSWECDRCHYHTYHAHATECADCGEDMPFEHVIAFKLHASATDVPELIRETAGEMGFDPDGPEVAHAIARTPLGSARARLARGEG